MTHELSPYAELEWPSEISNRAEKESIAAEVVSNALDGQVIGIGSGTTSFLCLRELVRRIADEGLEVVVCPTSHEIEWYCTCAGVTMVAEPPKVDWAVDGADEVDPSGDLIKGRGGAMLRERQVLDLTERRYIAVDRSKYVSRLGEKFRVPVEVAPSGAIGFADLWHERHGGSAELRGGAPSKDGPAITEHGNVVFDVAMPAGDAGAVAESIQAMPAVVAHGLFVGYGATLVSGS